MPIRHVSSFVDITTVVALLLLLLGVDTVVVTHVDASYPILVGCGPNTTMSIRGGGGTYIYMILPTTTNQVVVDIIHTALNRSLLLLQGDGTTTTPCTYYPAMYIVANMSCSSGSSLGPTGSSVLVALQQDEELYLRAGAGIGGVTATTTSYSDHPYTYTTPIDPSDPQSVLFNAANTSHLNGSSPYMRAVCRDYWGMNGGGLKRIESILTTTTNTQNVDITEVTVIENNVDNSSTSLASAVSTTTTSTSSVLWDDSVHELYQSRVGNVSNVSGTTSLTSMGYVWGTFLGIITVGGGGQGSASSAVVSASLLGGAHNGSPTTTITAPWYGWLAFAGGALLAVAFVVAVTIAVVRLCRTWNAVFQIDFGTVTREYESTMLFMLREHWWGNASVHPPPTLTPDGIAGPSTPDTQLLPPSPSWATKSSPLRPPPQRCDTTGIDYKELDHHTTTPTPYHDRDDNHANNSGGGDLAILSPLVAFQAVSRTSGIERLRHRLLARQSHYEEANQGEADTHTTIDVVNTSSLQDDDATLNKGMLVAQELGRRAVFDSFAVAYKADQTRMCMQLGREGHSATCLNDDGEEILVAVDESIPHTTAIRKCTTPLYLQMKDRVHLSTNTSQGGATTLTATSKYHPAGSHQTTQEQVVRGVPSLIPFLLISVAVLLSMLTVLLLAVGVNSLEEHPSHTAVLLVYGSAGCDQAIIIPNQQPHQAWFVAPSDRCEVASIRGVSTPFSPKMYVRASCKFDVSTSTSRLVLSMGETPARCEESSQHATTSLITTIDSTTNTINNNGSQYCVSSGKLLAGATTNTYSTQTPFYITGICVPTAIATSTQEELQRLRVAAVVGDGARVSVPLTPFDRNTEAFTNNNPNDHNVQVRLGDDDVSVLAMQSFLAVRTVGYVSPTLGDITNSTTSSVGASGTIVGALTTPLQSTDGGQPLASYEHGGGTTTNTLSARGFSFSPSVLQNTSQAISSSSTSDIVPLVQSPLRYLGVDATIFDLGLQTRFTLNFWMRAGRETRGYILAVANDWHLPDAVGRNVVLDALSHSLSRGGGTSGSSLADLVGSPHFKVYSAVSLDGPSSLLSLSFGEDLTASVSWDLSKLMGYEGRSALDGEWHMVTIQSDVKSGWQSFHLQVDSQTSYTDPAWHQCTPTDSSFSAAVPPTGGDVIQVPTSIANISRIRSDTAVAYVGYRFGGGASIAALQVFTNTANGEVALRQLSAPGMHPYEGGQLILAAILFTAVVVGAIVAVAQVTYSNHVEASKVDATEILSPKEQLQLKLVMKSRSRQAGKKAAQTAASTGVAMSKMYTSVRQLGVENGGNAVSRLRTIYPQFAGVCQAMAIYLSSWGWPEVFSDFATRLAFLFSFNFDLQFPSIPSVAMPIAQIILCGMLLVLAVFLTLNDQKLFYITAMGASGAASLNGEPSEEEEDNDDTKNKDNNDATSALSDVTESSSIRSVPDDYNFMLDTHMETSRSKPIKSESDVFNTSTTSSNNKVKRVMGFDDVMWRSRDEGGDKGVTEGDTTPQRTLNIRPHTRFRLVEKGWESLEEATHRHALRTEPIYTFGMLKTNRFGSKPRRDGIGWYEWRCMEGVVYTPRLNINVEFDEPASSSFAVRISELLAAFYREDAQALVSLTGKKSHFSKRVEDTTLSFPVYIVRGNYDRATSSNTNWHESSIPDEHAGMPPPTSLATYKFDAFMQTLSLSAHRAGLYLERGTLHLAKDPIAQTYTFAFHCEEVIRGPIGQTSKSPEIANNATSSSVKVYNVEPDKDAMYRCPRHLCSMIPYRRSFHSECTTCSNSYHDDCTEYMRTDGRKCSPTIALVCKEEGCGYCLCADKCANGANLLEFALQQYYGYMYLLWHSNINYVIGFFILILGQSLFLPVVQSAAMIATCHVDYQCDFPRCYEQMTIKYGVSLYFAFLALVITIAVMIPFFTYMIAKRKLFLLENRLVTFKGDFQSMGLLRKLLVEIDEEDWDLFLLQDSSILRALYEMYEFRYIAIHGVLLVFKVFLLLPVVFMERNSVGQLAFAGAVEVGLLVLLSATDAFINPWMDALARVGSFHQILQVGLVALSRVLDEYATPIGYSMIGVSVMYIAVLVAVIIHEIVLPYLDVRRARAAETELFRLRNITSKWLDLAFTSLLTHTLTSDVPVADYFTTDVLQGHRSPLYDFPNNSNQTPGEQRFEATELKLLAAAQDAQRVKPGNTTTTIIPIPFTHLLNKAIRTTPNDPNVYTEIATRLSKMRYMKRHTEPQEGGGLRHQIMIIKVDPIPTLNMNSSSGIYNRYNTWSYRTSWHLRSVQAAIQKLHSDMICQRPESSFRLPCPCVYVHYSGGHVDGGGYLSVLELQARAIEASPLSAELYQNAALSMVDFTHSGEVMQVDGEVLSVADILAKAVERAPDTISHRQRLIDYLLLRVECRSEAIATSPLDGDNKQTPVGMLEEQEDTVCISGVECDVLRLCEQYIERAPASSGPYALLARVMDRLRNAACITTTTSSASSPPNITTTTNNVETLNAMLASNRYAMVHGRAVRDPKDVLIFAIDVLHIVNFELLRALADALTAEEDLAELLRIPRSEHGSLGLVTLFGRPCSAVDVLGIAMLAHPDNHSAYAALEEALIRTYNASSTTTSAVEVIEEDGKEGEEDYEKETCSSETPPQYFKNEDFRFNAENDTQSVQYEESVISDTGGHGNSNHPNQPDMVMYGECSHRLVNGSGGGSTRGRITYFPDTTTPPSSSNPLLHVSHTSGTEGGEDDGAVVDPKDIPASWVLARMGCITTLDILAAEYLRRCKNRDAVLTYLRRLISLVKSRNQDKQQNDDDVNCILLNATRHPLQADRSNYGGGMGSDNGGDGEEDEGVAVVSNRWSMKEVIEHAISHHPDMVELYDMLYDWCVGGQEGKGGVDIGTIQVVMPLSTARRAATNTNTNTTSADDTGTIKSGRVMMPLTEIWGVLVEFDWGNPATFVKLARNCPPKARAKGIPVIKKALLFSIPVYLPQAAASLLPPTATQINEHSYQVCLNSMDALVMALRITPRDATLYNELIIAMQREQRRRTYIAHRCLSELDDHGQFRDKRCNVSTIVQKYFQPNSGGVICMIPIHISSTSSTTSPEGGGITVYCSLVDVACMAVEALGMMEYENLPKFTALVDYRKLGNLNKVVQRVLHWEHYLERDKDDESFVPSSSYYESEDPLLDLDSDERKEYMEYMMNGPPDEEAVTAMNAPPSKRAVAAMNDDTPSQSESTFLDEEEYDDDDDSPAPRRSPRYPHIDYNVNTTPQGGGSGPTVPDTTTIMPEVDDTTDEEEEEAIPLLSTVSKLYRLLYGPDLLLPPTTIDTILEDRCLIKHEHPQSLTPQLMLRDSSLLVLEVCSATASTGGGGSSGNATIMPTAYSAVQVSLTSSEIIRRVGLLKQLCLGTQLRPNDLDPINLDEELEQGFYVFPVRVFGSTWLDKEGLLTTLVSYNGVIAKWASLNVRSILFERRDFYNNTTLRPYIVAANTMSDTDRSLYESCEYAVDANGAPHRRSAQEKNTPLPKGCEITLLLSCDLKTQRDERIQKRILIGEELQGGGDQGIW